MAWQDTLARLREEMANMRAERRRQAAAAEAEHQQQRRRLSELADSLEVSTLLDQMNRTLLDGQGEVETVVSWEPLEEEEEEDDLDFDDGGEDDEEELGDVVSTILAWEEDGEREIVVDLGLNEEGFYLQANGVGVRMERGALEAALIQAFRDELEL